MNAAEDTKDEVIYDDDGEYMSISYDMFACGGIIELDGKKYYQVNQPVIEHDLIPYDFVQKHRGMFKDEWLICDDVKHEHHGRGMSQFGAFYHAEEEDVDYKYLLAYRSRT